MAKLDEGSVGIKLMSGLPEGNALPAYAAELLDDPRDVIALVRLRPSHKVDRFEEDTHTVVMRLVELEVLSGSAADTTRKQMEKLREKRTGVVSLPGIDGADVPAVEVAAEPEPEPEAVPVAEQPAAPVDLPVGPEWGDGEVPHEVEASTTATDAAAPPPAAVAPPAFTPPTSIASASGKRRAARS